MQSCLFPTEFGWSAAIWSDTGLKELKFGHPTPAAALDGLCETIDPTSPSKAARKLIARLQRFTTGKGDDDFLDVELDTCHLTAFGRAVIASCRQISSGQTLSYGKLAAIAGYPGAARAVGSVMRQNHWPLIVPCHRVVSSSGGLNGFNGGPERKKFLLNHEAQSLGRRPRFD